MNRRRDRSKVYSEWSYNLDHNLLHYNVDFEARAVKRWSGRLPRSPPPSFFDYVEPFSGNMGWFDGEDHEPGRPYSNSRYQGGARRRGMRPKVPGKHDYFNTNGFDEVEEEETDRTRPSVQRGPQSRHGMKPHYSDGPDGFDEEEMGPYGTSTQGALQNRRGRRPYYLDGADLFDEEGDIDLHRPSTRSEPRGIQDIRRGYSRMEGALTDMSLEAPGGGLESKSPQTADQTSYLRELEAQLDKMEEEKKQAIQESCKSKCGSAAHERCTRKVEQTRFIIREIQAAIYNMDPRSETLDIPARCSPPLPDESRNTHEPRRHGEDYGRHRARPHHALDNDY